MVYYVYIIYSVAIDQYYVGYTHDLTDRLRRHNNSGSKATKKASDWVLKYKEEYASASEAARRELEIKRKKSRRYIESLIAKAG